MTNIVDKTQLDAGLDSATLVTSVASKLNVYSAGFKAGTMITCTYHYSVVS